MIKRRKISESHVIQIYSKIKTKERKFKVNMERFMGGKDGKISGTLSEVQIWYQILIIFNIF